MPSSTPILPMSWRHQDVVEAVRAALGRPLPGLDGQVLMAPRPRPGWRPAHLPQDARVAAALLLLYPLAGHSCIPLTVRAPRLAQHGGQVSLPGGGVDRGESIAQAALREALEETGVVPEQVRVLGELSPLHIPVSGFVLHPVVGVADQRPEFVPAADEVARIVEVPLEQLADPGTLRLRLRRHEGRDYEVPYFAVAGEQVWGATAMVLAEFLSILGCAPGQPRAGTP